MATETIPTTITPEAAALAKEYGVERELEAILEKGREMVRGLRAIEVGVEAWAEEGDVCIVVRAIIDPASENDPSHLDWRTWRIDAFGWGEPSFSSRDNSLPRRDIPNPTVGTRFISSVLPKAPTYSRRTNQGTILLDTAGHTGVFIPRLVGTSKPGH